MVSGIYLAKVTRISSLRRKAKYNISEVAMCLYSCAMATVKNMREALHHQELGYSLQRFHCDKMVVSYHRHGEK